MELGLGVPEKQGWAGAGGEEECGAEAGRRVQQEPGRDAWLDIPWAHGLTPPRVLGPEQGQKTGSGHGKRARRQQRDQEGNRHGRREKKTQSEVTPGAGV